MDSRMELVRRITRGGMSEQAAANIIEEIREDARRRAGGVNRFLLVRRDDKTIWEPPMQGAAFSSTVETTRQHYFEHEMCGTLRRNPVWYCYAVGYLKPVKRPWRALGHGHFVRTSGQWVPRYDAEFEVWESYDIERGIEKFKCEILNKL